MQSIKGIFAQTIIDIEEVTECFYKQKNKEGYARLDGVLESISSAVDKIFEYKLENNSIEIDETRLISTLTDAMKAIEEKDTILLADIFQYEILEQFQKISNQI